MDEVKKYLTEHRSELDTDVPAEYIWDVIKGRTERVAPVRPMVFRWVAAASVLLALGLGTYFILSNRPEKDTVTVQHPINTISNPPQVNVKTNDLPKEEEEFVKPPMLFVKNHKAAKHKAAQPDMNALAKHEFTQMEKSFSIMISNQVEQLENTPLYAESDDYFSGFKQDLNQLGNDEQQIKYDIKKNGITSDAIQRLINVYQQKINLLKRLQAEINKMNNHVNRAGNEQKPTFITL